jgi:hypothetical protein
VVYPKWCFTGRKCCNFICELAHGASVCFHFDLGGSNSKLFRFLDEFS